MKKTSFLLFLIIIVHFFSSCDRTVCPDLSVSQLKESDGEIIIKKWAMLGPFHIDSTLNGFPDIDHLRDFGFCEDSISYIQFLSIGKKEKSEKLKKIKSLNYVLKNDYVELDKVFKYNGLANGYAACIIKSDVEQEIALLSGSNDGIKIWVNNKQHFENFNNKILRKNRNVVKVHLNKGENFVLLKVYNNSPGWQFHCCISSWQFVRKYMIYVGYETFTRHYLLEKGSKLNLNFDSYLIGADSICNIKIFDIDSNLKMNMDINPDTPREISLAKLNTGPYRCVLSTDNYVYDQPIKYGDFDHIFGINTDTIRNRILSTNKDTFYNFILKKLSQLNIDEKTLINLRVLFFRLYELYYFEIKYGNSEDLERKMAWLYYDLSVLSKKVMLKKVPFKHEPGLHLRSFKSKMDGIHDYYLVYIPKNYKKEEKIPMVVLVPFVEANQFPFYFSWHVAKNNKLDFLKTLSEKYGIAFLITSSRFFNIYNLSPMVSEATFEAIDEVKEDYSIDNDRIYLYGDCSGGLIALLACNRYPSTFAATCVIGPDISYTSYSMFSAKNIYPKSWVKENDIFNFVKNYKNIPLLIIQSKNDEKSSYKKSKKLVEAINKTGGSAYLDDTLNPTKTTNISMFTDNINYNKAFMFFNGKKRGDLNEIILTTSQLKYGKNDWISIEGKEMKGIASIDAKILNNHTIQVNLRNISEYLIHFNQLPQLDLSKPIKVITNGNISYEGIIHDLELGIKNSGIHENKLTKNKEVEGPINHLFSKKFMVVRGTKGNEEQRLISDSIFYGFVNNWKMNYFEACRFKDDIQISDNDIQEYNLVLCGTATSNAFINKIQPDLPVKIGDGFLEINNKTYNGKDIVFKMIYPNPHNKNRYILLLTATGNKFNIKSFQDISYKGYYDYEMSNSSNKFLDAGYFDNNWEF